jgi:hypothetical protein
LNLDFKGGDRLKFSDVILAVASWLVVFILVHTVLSIALIPMNSYWGFNVDSILSFLISGLIVGYVFAGKIREESRMVSIGKIVVLSAVLTIFATMIGVAATGHYNAWVDESLRNMYSSGSWTNTDWVGFEHMMLLEWVAFPVVFALALGFIGLYLGSIRKPSAKTKE